MNQKYLKKFNTQIIKRIPILVVALITNIGVITACGSLQNDNLQAETSTAERQQNKVVTKENKQTKDFNTVNTAAQNKFVWEGKWKIPSRFRNSSLIIKMLSAAKFKFEIDSVDGANILGKISGTATVKDDTATFAENESDNINFDKKGCRLTFTHKDNLIKIEQTDGCLDDDGSGTVFEGEYLKGNPKPIEQDFVELEVFPNNEIDQKFKTLVGKDYETFLNAFHMIIDEENKDDFNAKIFSGCVRGICPFNAGIIMFNDKGNLWAAVLSDKDKKIRTVNYYSNTAEWKDKMPKTIQSWVEDRRSDMSDELKLVFKN